MYSGDMSANKRFTNIHLLNNFLEYNDERQRSQVIHYKRGIGSAQEKFRRITNYTQGIFGLGIWNDIEEIYLNICANFESTEAPDKIYLFGFSRGAAVARAVAELVDIGILHTDKIDNVGDAIQIYRDRFHLKSRSRIRSDAGNDSLQRLKEKEEKFRSNCHACAAEVEFLGLFDTVLGGIHITKRLQELNMLNSSPSMSVKHCVQLLAIDEERNLFRPSVFSRNNNRKDATLEQIWMPGTHSNVGGGIANDNLSLISLLTMIDRVLHHTELKFRVEDLKRLCNQEVVSTTVENEWTLIWFLLCGLHKFNSDGKRKPKGESAKLHKVADLMSRDKITFKKRSRTQDYEIGPFSKLEFSPLFISEKFKDHTIRV